MCMCMCANVFYPSDVPYLAYVCAEVPYLADVCVCKVRFPHI